MYKPISLQCDCCQRWMPVVDGIFRLSDFYCNDCKDLAHYLRYVTDGNCPYKT